MGDQVSRELQDRLDLQDLLADREEMVLLDYQDLEVAFLVISFGEFSVEMI